MFAYEVVVNVVKKRTRQLAVELVFRQVRSKFLSAKDFNEQLMVLMSVKVVTNSISFLDTVRAAVNLWMWSPQGVGMMDAGPVGTLQVISRAGVRLSTAARHHS